MDDTGSDSEPTGLVDTDILIDAAHDVPAAIEFLERQRGRGGIRVSVVSAMELVAGSRDARELRVVSQFLTGVVVEPITPEASLAALQLMASLYLAHGLLIADALIAATALDLELPLFTRNVRHYRRVEGLDVRQPYLS